MKRRGLLAVFDRWSIRRRLSVSYTLLIVIPLSVLAGFLLQSLDHYYVAQLQAYMRDEAGLLATSTAATLSVGRPVEALLLQNNPPLPLHTRPRVLLFDNAGRLLLTSDGNLVSRIGQAVPEAGVQAALAGHPAQGIEPSASSDAVIDYVARPVLSGGQVLGAVLLDYSLDDVRAAQRQLRTVVVGAGIAAALLATLLSVWVAGSITRPLGRLGAVAASIAGGNFTQRSTEAMPAELAVLARQLNQMAAALEQAERARQITFANLAHDVRTPLGSIRAAAEALAAGADQQPALRARLIGGLVEQSQYLGRLTDDLLRLATYEAGDLILRRTAVALPGLLRQVYEAEAVKAQARGVRLAADWRGALPAVSADADRLLEVLFNLLENAVTHTPPGGQVRLWVELDRPARGARLHVSDTGPGIPPDALPHIFERYWRGDHRRRPGDVNMGLGLNIAYEIVRAHGSRLQAANRPEGGADFSFWLPLAEPPRLAGLAPRRDAPLREARLPAAPLGRLAALETRQRRVSTSNEAGRDAPSRSRRLR